jgi:hypothetical protein
VQDVDAMCKKFVPALHLSQPDRASDQLSSRDGLPERAQDSESQDGVQQPVAVSEPADHYQQILQGALENLQRDLSPEEYQQLIDSLLEGKIVLPWYLHDAGIEKNTGSPREVGPGGHSTASSGSSTATGPPAMSSTYQLGTALGQIATTFILDEPTDNDSLLPSMYETPEGLRLLFALAYEDPPDFPSEHPLRLLFPPIRRLADDYLQALDEHERQVLEDVMVPTFAHFDYGQISEFSEDIACGRTTFDAILAQLEGPAPAGLGAGLYDATGAASVVNDPIPGMAVLDNPEAPLFGSDAGSPPPKRQKTKASIDRQGPQTLSGPAKQRLADDFPSTCRWSACGARMPLRDVLDHVKTTHGADLRTSRCLWIGCGRIEAFYNRTALLKHLKAHITAPRDFPCSECHAVFSRRKALAEHHTLRRCPGRSPDGPLVQADRTSTIPRARQPEPAADQGPSHSIKAVAHDSVAGGAHLAAARGNAGIFDAPTLGPVAATTPGAFLPMFPPRLLTSVPGAAVASRRDLPLSPTRNVVVPTTSAPAAPAPIKSGSTTGENKPTRIRCRDANCPRVFSSTRKARQHQLKNHAWTPQSEGGKSTA